MSGAVAETLPSAGVLVEVILKSYAVMHSGRLEYDEHEVVYEHGFLLATSWYGTATVKSLEVSLASPTTAV